MNVSKCSGASASKLAAPQSATMRSGSTIRLRSKRCAVDRHVPGAVAGEGVGAPRAERCSFTVKNSNCGKGLEQVGLYLAAAHGQRAPTLTTPNEPGPRPMKDFPRIQRLPPYVFNITAELKMAARRAGDDIIDLSMGNPDGPTPKHIVDKLVECGAAPGHARLLGVEGHPAAAARDLQLVPAPLRRRARSGQGGDRHDRLEGRHRAPGARHPRPRRHRAGAEPELPDPHLRPGHRRRRHPARAQDAGRRLLRRARARDQGVVPEAEDADHQLPGQPDRAVRRAGVLRAHRRARAGSTTSSSCTTSPTPTSCSTATGRRRSCRCRARATWRSSSSPCRRATTWPAGASASWSATATWCRRSRASRATTTTARSRRSRSPRSSRSKARRTASRRSG